MSFHSSHLPMGEIKPCDYSVSEAMGCRSHECNPFLGQVLLGDDLLTLDCEEFVVETLHPENLCPDEDDQSNLVLQEIENMHIHDSICPSASNFLFSSPHTKELSDFSKCAAPSSEILQSSPSKVVSNAKSSTIEAGCNSNYIANDPYEATVIPLLVCTGFISALKGTRARQGKPLIPNLHVTWAANVYDPPATSSSHTVKGHRHRLPKTKEHHKHKHARAKPHNSSSGDKKRSHRSSRSIVDSRMARPQAIASRSLQIGFGHKVQALDIAAAVAAQSQFAAQSRESKCGGSFHSESPWLLPLPAAEAS